MNGSRFANKKIIVIHLLFWVGYLLLSVFVFAGREDIDKAIWISLIQIIPQIIIAYINMEWLIPSFFIRLIKVLAFNPRRTAAPSFP